MRRRDGICPSCGTTPKADDCAYCIECRRARGRGNYRKRTFSPVREATKSNAQSCNCGDAGCKGFCNVVRA